MGEKERVSKTKTSLQNQANIFLEISAYVIIKLPLKILFKTRTPPNSVFQVLMLHLHDW